MLRRFPIESKGRRKKLREVGCVTAICFICFTIRSFIVSGCVQNAQGLQRVVVVASLGVVWLHVCVERYDDAMAMCVRKVGGCGALWFGGCWTDAWVDATDGVLGIQQSNGFGRSVPSNLERHILHGKRCGQFGVESCGGGACGFVGLGTTMTLRRCLWCGVWWVVCACRLWRSFHQLLFCLFCGSCHRSGRLGSTIRSGEEGRWCEGGGVKRCGNATPVHERHIGRRTRWSRLVSC